MTQQQRFDPSWEPSLQEEEILAQGTWWYDGTVPHSATLKRLRFDYSSDDLETLEATLDPINLDYVDYAINSEGEIYVWFFVGPTGSSQSKSLSTFAEAKNHIHSYGRVEIRWHPEDVA